MATVMCLLNLDTGDFIDLGKLFFHPDAVEEVGCEGGHYLLNRLPSIPYGSKAVKESQKDSVELTQRYGHSLNAFFGIFNWL